MTARKIDPAAINFILEHPEPMTESEAQEYAPQWGSYMRNGDPGSIMYSAIPPETAEHRDQMIAYRLAE